MCRVLPQGLQRLELILGCIAAMYMAVVPVTSGADMTPPCCCADLLVQVPSSPAQKES